jgi:hypothetical protein
MRNLKDEVAAEHEEAKHKRESERNELKAAKARLAQLKKEKHLRDAKREAIEAWEEVERLREQEANLNASIAEAKAIIEPTGSISPRSPKANKPTGSILHRLQDCEHFLQKHGQPWRYDHDTFEIVEKGEIRMPMRLLRAYRHVYRRAMWKNCTVKSNLMIRWLAISSRRPDSAPPASKKPEWDLLPTPKNLSGAVDAPWRPYLLQDASCCNLGNTALDRKKRTSKGCDYGAPR